MTAKASKLTLASATTYVVEKGVPLAPKCRLSRSAYPFDGMDVGDSFFIPAADKHAARKAQILASANAGNQARSPHRTGRRFATRLVEGGVRVWRTA